MAAEPITLGVIAWAGVSAVLGGVLGSPSDRVACRIYRDVMDRIAGLRGLPANHDVARAVRVAQLQALERVVGDFGGADLPEWRTDPVNKPAWFVEEAHRFIGRHLRRCREVVLNVDVTTPLTEAVNGILTSPTDGSAQERMAAARGLAEHAVLSELAEALDGIVIPDEFLRRFRGDVAGAVGWHDAFAAYLLEQIKRDERFRAIFITGALAELIEHVRAVRDYFERERRLTEQLQREHDITDAALGAFFAVLGEKRVAPERLIASLTEIASRHRELRERLEAVSNEAPDLARLKERAAAALDEGQLDDADLLLARAEAREDEAIRRQEERMREALAALREEKRRAAGTRARRGDLAMMRLDYRAAAEHFAAAVMRHDRDDAESRFPHLLKQVEALQRQGEEFGDIAALEEAAALSRRAGDLRSRAASQEDWLAARQALIWALWRLGELGTGRDHLEEAARLSRDLLSEELRQAHPSIWARLQHSHGTVLFILGQREAGTVRLEEAAAAFRLALEVRLRERAPLDWAATQTNLGNALGMLGERESGTARLQDAATAYRSALTVRTRERVPLDWAMTQNNLGNVLAVLGERENGTDRLEQAVTAYRSALTVRTRERVPLHWATTQNNLGKVLTVLGEREDDTGRLEEAVETFRLALEVRTRERELLWAATQSSLGDALRALGERENGTARLEEAVEAFRLALEVRTRERELLWAITQNGLGRALCALGERRDDPSLLEGAVRACEGAIAIFSATGASHYAEEARETLSRVQAALFERRASPQAGSFTGR